MSAKGHYGARGRLWLGIGLVLAVYEARAVEPPPAEPSAAVSASNQFLAAYDSMTMADWLKQQGLHEDAVASYAEAQQQFVKLAHAYPTWQSDLVAYRRRYCEEQLAALGGGSAAVRPAVPAIPAPAVSLGGQPTMPDRPEAASAGPTGAAPVGAGSAAAGSPPVPTPFAAELQQALAWERTLDLAAAIEQYAAVLVEQPGHREALKGLLRCYLRKGEMAQARARIQQGIIIPTTETELHTMIAMVDCYDGRFSAAVQRLTPVLRENPASAAAHVVMGIAQMGMGRVDAAETEMKKALGFNAKLGEAYYNLARISLARNPNDLAAVKVHYHNALKYGVAPDPTLEKRLRP